MNNNFFSLLINPAKKNTDRSVLKENTVSDSFKKIVDKDGIQKKYDNNIERPDIYEQFVNYLF